MTKRLDLYRTAGVLALVLWGCGSGGGGGSPAPAPANLNPIGTYSLTFTKTAGTCGNITSVTLITISQIDATHWLWTQEGTTPTGGTMSCDPDKCTGAVSLSVSATIALEGVSLPVTGTLAYSGTITKTGMTGTHNASIAVKDPLNTSITLSTCSGTYNVLGPKLTAKMEEEPIFE